MIKALYIIGVLLLIIFNQCRIINSSLKTEQDTIQNRLVVSFISVGGGIDKKTKMEFEKLIYDFNASKKCHVGYETITWEKDGRIDYCFPAGQVGNLEKFVKKVKAMMEGKEWVRLRENTV